MRFFDYIDGELCAETVPLRAIAEAVGTPTYVYSKATLEHHYNVLKAALHGLDINIAFAIKANSNAAVIATLATMGAGADTVSEGEILRAMRAGVPSNRIVFSGVGKTKRELEFAIKTEIHQINVESEQELITIAEIANNLGKVQNVVIRVNPDVEAGGHSKIATGYATSKFGVSPATAFAMFENAKQLSGVKICGLAVHIGSQIIDIAPMRAAYEALALMVQQLRLSGHAITRLDLGGGLGAIYDDKGEGPDLEAYGQMVREIIGPLGVKIEIEPGRLICANAGVLLARALVTKANGGREFVVIDAAMNDLLRPAFYDAYHQILAVKEPPIGANLMPITVVGPICETGDTFTVDRPMAKVNPDDLLAFMSAGAYGFAMASTYNSRPLAAEVMVSGDKWQVVRARQSYEDMWQGEVIPNWG
ncbi:MAG: diaminopimelate decarboxylase [Hyphomonadaceae bacterium]|nr:MAG: diaminopimelate decarboxylase [Hyphomonadaceae bacterium]KAF0187071.1 MAG: diaminopimelate decarboxylase [Hyphomonadaceae bacterium]